jgi:hypothetical protein
LGSTGSIWIVPMSTARLARPVRTRRAGWLPSPSGSPCTCAGAIQISSSSCKMPRCFLWHRDMIEAIEAIAKEDLFYGINHDEVLNPPGMVRDTLTNLAFAARSGLKVFVVEYLSSAAASRRVGERISVLGYLLLITERGLGTFDHTPQDVPANPSAVPSPTPKPHPSDARRPRGWQRPLAGRSPVHRTPF